MVQISPPHQERSSVSGKMVTVQKWMHSTQDWTMAHIPHLAIRNSISRDD